MEHAAAPGIDRSAPRVRVAPGSVGVRAHALHPTDGGLRELVKKATDGCVNIFVDAGANLGVLLVRARRVPKVSLHEGVLTRLWCCFQ
eukprot:scaffold423_cov69-Phaeocystis_antarctica.AAC.8